MPARIHSGATPKRIATDLGPLLAIHEQGIPLEELQRLVRECLVPHLVHYGHPGFHSLYNFVPDEGAAFGAEVALEHNQGVTNWQVSPGGVMLEELCCQMLCRLFGLDSSADATFMYSGTYANHQALYLALHRKAERCGFSLAEEGIAGFPDSGRLAVIASEEAHFSIRQTLRMLGLGERSLVKIPADENRRMDVGRLRKTLLDLQEHRDVVAVVITAGISSTGSLDPIGPVIDVCEDLDAWIHIDGAYGFAYRLLPEYKDYLAGSERADSVTWDPHKQFGVPIPCSVLFCRRREDFERMALYSGYFNREGEVEPNPGLKSAPSTRPLSALPLVATMRHLGLEGIRRRLRTPLEAIRALIRELAGQEDIELMLEPDLGIVCLRIKPPGHPEENLDALQQYLYERTMSEAERSISMTEIDGKAALRFLVVSKTVTARSLMETIQYLRRLVPEFPMPEIRDHIP
jgi:L-2,4-diaminobutyrate decarboxylase